MSSLATLTRRVIRRRTWVPENTPPFFHMSKDIAKHARRGFDTTDLDKALAYSVYCEMAAEGTFDREARPLIEMAREIFQTCEPDGFGPVCQAAFDSARKGGAMVPAPTTMQYAVLERIQQDSDARIAEFGDPYKTIGAAVDAAKVSHPRLGLSFGYIGGVGPSCGEFGDDRSWKVFAKLATSRCANACDVSFGGVDTDRIEDLAAMMGDRFQSWLSRCEEDLDARRVRVVGDRAAA